MPAMMEGQSRHGMSTKDLRGLADSLFTKKLPILSLHQEIAEHMYPERADFTVKRYLSDDFAGNLMTSYPMLCRRDLGDQINTMLRNTNKPWFELQAKDDSKQDHEGKAWLEWATGTMRRVMYAPATLFEKATGLADNDFAAFGAAAITVRMNSRQDDLVYRCWHLRDMAWMEDEDGKLCAYFRRWKPSTRTLCRMFDTGRAGCSVNAKVRERAAKDPNEEVECYHMMVAADMYDGDARGMPWRSIYYDAANDHEMQCVAQRNKEYVVPRWLMAFGSQYPHSPATIAALPEARLLQAMTYTLLSAGEKVVNPPMVATEQAIRSDVAIYPGGLTWVDMEYDETKGAAIRALTQDARGMPLSQEMQKDSRALINQCFYLNKLALPQRAPEMTAYEIGQRVQEYIRGALPLFTPMEPEYNGGLCEETFAVIDAAGGFGAPQDRPQSVQGPGVAFRFSSPLHDAIEQQKGHMFLEMSQMLAQAAALDKTAYSIVDVHTAFRDALEGSGIPAKWTRSESEADAMVKGQQQQEQTAQLLDTMTKGAGVSKDLAQAQQLRAQSEVA